ncbi:MAG: acyl-CoA dehydrogenase family protein, partial [Pseudomonadota bacterium]|nr:acyl-CoA dehydrogenase family protein [Pseudomonadota bacterium]
MDFKDSAQEGEFRVEVRKFLDAHAPLRTKSTESAYAEAKTDADRVAIAKRWQGLLAEHGWACIAWPTAFGGRDATPIESVIWNQEVSRYVTPDGLFIIGQGMCAPTLMAYGNDAHKAAHLPKIASGEEVWCQLFSEPVAGSDLAG